MSDYERGRADADADVVAMLSAVANRASRTTPLDSPAVWLLAMAQSVRDGEHIGAAAAVAEKKEDLEKHGLLKI